MTLNVLRRKRPATGRARAREFCEAVEKLQKTSNEVEAFIHALDETGRVHRGCERSRSQVDKHLTGHGY